MAGFDDLIPNAQPALCILQLAATEGKTWRWELTILDDDDNPVDLTGVTITGTVYSSRATVPTRVPVLALTCTGTAEGVVTIGADAADTAGLAGATGTNGAIGVVLTRGADPVQLCVPSDSPFKIYSED